MRRRFGRPSYRSWFRRGRAYRTAFCLAGVLLSSLSLASEPAVRASIPGHVAKDDPRNDETPEPESTLTPQVEIHIPSVAELARAARHSKSARLFHALSGLVPSSVQDTDESLDVKALLDLLGSMGEWPDTSVSIATYVQDREGRPRWAVELDWPLQELVGNINDVLESEAASKLLEGVDLRANGNGTYRLELPDVVLAVLSETGSGSRVCSAKDLRPPKEIFGRPSSPEGDGEQAASATSNPSKKKPSLLYCRLNLEAGEEDQQGSLFTTFSGIRDIHYKLSSRRNGEWSERLGVIWNPIVGLFLKTLFQKAKKSFDCPREAYAVAVLNLGGLGRSLPDGLAGLPDGTLGRRVGSEMAFSAAPGMGFFPLPDVFYQFKTRKKEAIVEALRAFIAKDAKERRDNDRQPAWHEDQIDGRLVFWKDPGAEEGPGLMPVTYRTVVFFDGAKGADSKRTHLIIAQSSNWADDAIERWKELRGTSIRLPSSKKNHWQARLNWRLIYGLIQPTAALFAGFTKDAEIPPDAEELSAALSDSVIGIRIGYSGLRIRHTGPVPFGAVYVPAVTVASLRSVPDDSSEAARERVACRHLRVLHHHATLFRKDYGRWPATVEELDGYVDFASHPQLLRLREKDKSLLEGLASLLVSEDKAQTDSQEDDEEDAIDDALYVIAWSERDADWRLGIREGEFVEYDAIYIDAEGEIHRVPKERVEDTEDAEGVERVSEAGVGPGW